MVLNPLGDIYWLWTIMICTCDGNSLQNHVSSSEREKFFVFRLFVSPISGQLFQILMELT